MTLHSVPGKYWAMEADSIELEPVARYTESGAKTPPDPGFSLRRCPTKCLESLKLGSSRVAHVQGASAIIGIAVRWVPTWGDGEISMREKVNERRQTTTGQTETKFKINIKIKSNK
ncbi:conserved hypothetical protein [Coccidioides posadasii str. Silveira]|uniref:Uncharacterized protein n=1 Tax=Coccidioides posadasii (strain RMSCC 757 / Silveira) TaxID=443226 RepID=E9DBN5_COCPS|nr:conserved hypothetical protein [Coccidioides posadasii str. Silveira]